jgi:hypothetical protein
MRADEAGTAGDQNSQCMLSKWPLAAGSFIVGLRPVARRRIIWQ